MNGVHSDNIVLHEGAPEESDEWIVSLTSDIAHDGAVVGTFSPSGGILLDRLANEDGDSGDIYVDGRPLTGRVVTNGSGGGGTGEGSSDGGNGGGSTTGTPAAPVAPHPRDCGTDDGAAAQVAKHVKGELPTGVSGPVDPVKTASGNDWSQVEFGALIVKNSDGSFGALNDTIYSNDLSNYIQINYNTGQPVVGFWHSHPGARLGDIDIAKIRYPSSTDWDTLARIAGAAGAASNPSLWLMDSKGVTREFKLDERSYFEGLDDAQKVGGEGLAGRERSQSCG